MALTQAQTPMDQSDTHDAQSKIHPLYDSNYPSFLLPSRHLTHRRGSSDFSVPISVVRCSGWFDDPPSPRTPAADLVPLDMSWIRVTSRERLDSDSGKEKDARLPDHLEDDDTGSRRSSRQSHRTAHVYEPFGTSTIHSALTPASNEDDPNHSPPPASLPELVAELHRMLHTTAPNFFPDLDAVDVEDNLLVHQPHDSLVHAFWGELEDDEEEVDFPAAPRSAPVVDYRQGTGEHKDDGMTKTVLETIPEEEEDCQEIDMPSKICPVPLCRHRSTTDLRHIEKNWFISDMNKPLPPTPHSATSFNIISLEEAQVKFRHAHCLELLPEESASSEEISPLSTSSNPSTEEVKTTIILPPATPSSSSTLSSSDELPKVLFPALISLEEAREKFGQPHPYDLSPPRKERPPVPIVLATPPKKRSLNILKRAFSSPSLSSR